MIPAKHETFLIKRCDAGVTGHSGRCLFDHLVGTHDLLRSWGNPQFICDAGLYHSIYGTTKFRHQSWPLSDRKTVIEMIGPEAEELVYWFCATQRPRELIETPGPVRDINKNNHKKVLSQEILSHLHEIEAANLLEQSTRFSQWLRMLHRKNISAGAKQAIREREVICQRADREVRLALAGVGR